MDEFLFLLIFASVMTIGAVLYIGYLIYKIPVGGGWTYRVPIIVASTLMIIILGFIWLFIPIETEISSPTENSKIVTVEKTDIVRYYVDDIDTVFISKTFSIDTLSIVSAVDSTHLSKKIGINIYNDRLFKSMIRKE